MFAVDHLRENIRGVTDFFAVMASDAGFDLIIFTAMESKIAVATITGFYCD